MHGYKGPDINTGKKGKLGANAGKKGKLGANEARSREAQVGPVSRQGRRDEHFTDNFKTSPPARERPSFVHGEIFTRRKGKC